MAAAIDSQDSFNILSSKIAQLSLGRTKNDRSVINSTLNDLNSFNYKYPVVTTPAKAVLLVNQCCTLIPPEDLELVLKCCHLITNLITRQNVKIDGRTLTVSVLWCLQSLKGQSTDVDILEALDALLRGATGHDLIVEVVKSGPLMTSARNDKNPEMAFFALQCLEACTVDNVKSATESQTCFNMFLNYVTTNNLTADKLINIKIYIICLRGLQNIIKQRPELLSDNLGVLLGVTKSYMLLGISGIEFVKPQKLMPTPLSVPETSASVTRERGGKMMKHRKPKTQGVVMKLKKSEKWGEDNSYTPATNLPTFEDGYSSVGNTVKTSDSDFSDTEGGNAAKLAVMTGRLRQAALALFLHSAKLMDKTVLFSYWSSFIPENPLTNRHNLVTCILKETSNRGRMAALNALLILLTPSKLYLAQAEKGDNLAFTPFSVVLGLTIKELHKCLSLALTAYSVPVLTMVLKCFAALVQATPYHRLDSGLITKVVRNVKPFIYHKDCTVQVTALIVLGCVLASEPLIPETREIFTRNVKEGKPEVEMENFDFPDASLNENGCRTPGRAEVSWLLERCLSNLGVNLDGDTIEDNVPMPVKLESLQIISGMSRNYFEVMLLPSMSIVTKALNLALLSKYPDVQFHAGRAIDFMGQAMNRCLLQENNTISLQQCLPFWQTLINDSLTTLLQSEQNPLIRGIGCDCLGSMGADIFEQLTRDKQILCVTLLFACTRDEEGGVRGAAVRALAIWVLYPSLSEDSGFVVDAAEAIYRVLQDESFAVRVKCSWAVGNLSDALVLNKSNELMEEFPKSLTLRLIKAVIKASNDSDKIKMNTVRALGNFLQLIEGEQFKELFEEGINVLVKNCASGASMKVRWNSCYAVGNAMKNPCFFSLGSNWQEKVFTALSDLVVNFRNFKVRTNAALALSAPSKREHYQQYYQHIWMSLLKGLETSQNMEDFNEYKHRDNLIEQICLTLGHLITLLTNEDLLLLKHSVQSEHLKVQMRRVWDRLLPEKSTVLFDAHAHVTSLSNSCDLTIEQRDTLLCLSQVLRHDF